MKRYAQACFELAVERNALDGWQEALKRIAALKTDEKLMRLLENPQLVFDAKKSLLEERLKGVHPLALNLAFVLTAKGNLRRGDDLLQEFNRLVDAHRGTERARVTTAMPLGDEESQSISRRLGGIVHAEVAVESQVDPSMIGGFIARIGDLLIDGSVRQRLETLRKQLTAG